MTASYLHDSLRQLCEVVAQVVGEAKSGTVVFVDEPGEHHLHLTRNGAEVSVKVVWYDEWVSDDTELASPDRVILESRMNVDDLLAETLGAVDRLFTELGAAEYRRRWVQHDFPSDARESLRRLSWKTN